MMRRPAAKNSACGKSRRFSRPPLVRYRRSHEASRTRIRSNSHGASVMPAALIARADRRTWVVSFALRISYRH